VLINRLSFVGERVCDIAFWKEEVLAEIQRMESECDNLAVIFLSYFLVILRCVVW